MSWGSSRPTDRILMHLAEIGAGRCTITDDSIVAEPDPEMSQVLAQIHRLNRVERWLYNGFHSLDFAFWYDKRPLWDIGMLTLLLGGLMSSTIGLLFGIRRIWRSLAGPSKSWLDVPAPTANPRPTAISRTALSDPEKV